MECGGSTNKDQNFSNIFPVEASGDSHDQSDNSKIHQEKSQQNIDHEVEDDAESSNYKTKDNLGNSQQVISDFEEDNYDKEEQDDGQNCSTKEENTCKDFVEEKEEEQVSSRSMATNVEDEVERNRLFWQTCFEVGYP